MIQYGKPSKINEFVIIKKGGTTLKFDLKPDINMIDFLHTVDLCEGDVQFESFEGDILNLKSQFSKYLFLTAAPDMKYLSNCKISCTKEDAIIISKYIVTNDSNAERND